MNKTKIKLVLKAKFEHFLKSIDDEALKELIRENTIITGGCITSMLLNEAPNDFDIYFRNVEVTKKVAEYFVDKFTKKHSKSYAISVASREDRVCINIKSAGIASSNEEEATYEYFEQYDSDENNTNAVEYLASTNFVKNKEDKGKYEVLCLTENAITLSDKIQIIIRFSGTPDVIHKNFDFVHCQCYWDSGTNELVFPDGALESILTKELRYSGSLFPIATLFRIRKFVRRGWNINAGQIFKIAYQISQLDLTDTSVLREQLTGCDVAYFHSLISKLQEIENGEQITNDYLLNLVDQIFDGD